MGTTRNQKIQYPPYPPSSPKKKKPWASWVHVALPHWLIRIPIPSFVCLSPFSS
jgi:hypothetical protein